MNFLGTPLNNNISAEVRYAAITKNNPIFVAASHEETPFKKKVIETLKETMSSIKEANRYITVHYPKTFKV